jgi:hypothetical protein
MKQRCRYCKCTWEDGCPVGCAWISADLCTTCGAFMVHLHIYLDSCRRVTKASLARMLDEISRPFLGEKKAAKKARAAK